MCGWDGAGGQLSVGEVGPWDHRRPSTRLVVTGTGPERADLVAAFGDLLLGDREIAAGLAPWLVADDVLAPWLGDRSEAA